MMTLKEHVGYTSGAHRNLGNAQMKGAASIYLVHLGVFNLINRELILAPGTFTVS